MWTISSALSEEHTLSTASEDGASAPDAEEEPPSYEVTEWPSIAIGLSLLEVCRI